MPKDTFINLDEEKKRRIFDAAVKEFSTRRFSEASINQIVKSAGIPRGSFYQYFNDKEDIYLYMYEEILREKRANYINDPPMDLEADIFELCIHTLKASLKWSRAKPEYYQISILMELDDSEFIVKLWTNTVKVLKDLIERDKKRGLIRPEIDSDLVVDLIYTLIIKENFGTLSDENLFMRKIQEVMQIIKKGIATE